MTRKKSKYTILVVDDSPNTREVLRRNLESTGFIVLTAEDVNEAVPLLNDNPVDLVITDLKMPGPSGIDLIRYVHENFRRTEIIMITGYPTVQTAVDAVKSGAEAYLSKPFTDEELMDAVNQSLEKLSRKKTEEVASPATSSREFGMIGESVPMKRIFEEISMASGTYATVLITGESGTGKELVARAIHYEGKRASSPFIPVNCGGIPESLLESELFGHVKGAFTGATESRAGFFQAADGGTIFLDEISETSLGMQVKLLRVLQDKEVLMVGANNPRTVDVRVVAATNKNLEELVKKGIFREDLYYRLNVIKIILPPLRERTGDIPLLARHFAKKYAGAYDKAELKFTDEVLATMEGYSWPGNVRELENIVQRIVVMSRNEDVKIADLPEMMRFSIPNHFRCDRTLEEVEREHIAKVLQLVNGNKSKAARILNIDRKTLRDRIAKYQLPD
ncbi:MAG TPA: sigma-54 dependent transcriptional regulator [bacterium]|jgi:DNA-binding NtrC family response regulator